MGALVDRLKQHLLGRWLMTYFIDSPGPHYAPAIAFTAFVAIFPIVLGAVSLLLILNPDSALAQQVEVVIRDTFPVGTRIEIQTMFREFNRHPGTVGLVSLGAMVWAGTAMFAILGSALNALHGIAGRNLLHQRLMGLRLLAALGVALVIMVVMTEVSSGLPMSRLVTPLISGLVVVMLLVFTYRVAPNIRRPVRDVLPGAVIGAVLIELATYTFPAYGRLTEQISTYGRGVALALVLLFYLYLVSHIILLGAHFNDTRWDMRAEREALEPAVAPATDTKEAEGELVSGVKY